MTVGPLELVVIQFEGDSFHGEIARELGKVLDQGIIRLIDLVFVRKDSGSDVSVLEVDDLRDDEMSPYAGIIGNLMGLLTPEDLSKVIAALPERCAALVALFEHSWAAGLKQAIQRANGTLVASERISEEALDELNAELVRAS